MPPFAPHTAGPGLGKLTTASRPLFHVRRAHGSSLPQGGINPSLQAEAQRGPAGVWGNFFPRLPGKPTEAWGCSCHWREQTPQVQRPSLWWAWPPSKTQHLLSAGPLPTRHTASCCYSKQPGLHHTTGFHKYCSLFLAHSFPGTSLAPSFTFFKSLPTCHLLNEASPNCST